MAALGCLVMLVGVVFLLLNYGHRWLGRVGPDGYDDGWRRGYRAGTKQIALLCKATILLGAILFLVGAAIEGAT